MKDKKSEILDNMIPQPYTQMGKTKVKTVTYDDVVSLIENLKHFSAPLVPEPADDKEIDHT